MLRNYLTVALRNLWRNKMYTFINVLGLGIGLATMVWAWQNYRFAMSFDTMHPHPETTWRLDIFREGSEVLRGIVPLPLGSSAKADFASIEEVLRISSKGVTAKVGDREPFSETVHHVDPNFFEFFHFPLLAGSNDLTNRSTILITQEMAEKYFGAEGGKFESALGQTLTFDAGEPNEQSFTVKGVLENPPKNTSVWFSFLTHFDNEVKANGEPLGQDDWSVFVDAVFFQLPDPSSAPRLAEDLKKYIGPQNAAREDWKITGFHLDPLLAVAHHNEDMYSNYLNNSPPVSATYGPVVLALLIFLLCCLNFTNTTVARSNRRLKEMGVRKVMGGSQRQLVWQMLLECGFITLLSVFVAVGINEYWFPAYNEMWPYLHISTDYFSDPGLLLFLLGMVVVATLLAGSYPAFYISRFNPSNIFRGGVKFGGSNLFSRILLGLQVVISLMTVISAIGFQKNSAFQKNYDYGYDMANLMFVGTGDPEAFPAFRDAVAQLPDVEMTAGTRFHLGHSYRSVTMEAQGERKETMFLEVGEDYLDLTGLEFKDGRSFDPSLGTDFENAMLVNEKLSATFGWKPDEILGKRVQVDTVEYSVVGLLQDFHIDNLFNPIEPVAIRLGRPDGYRFLVVKSAPGKINSVHDQVKATWEKLYPYRPFDGRYQNSIAAEALLVTDNIAWIFGWFAVISVMLTAIGLFALVSLTVLKKMKEIAVRKVVGAAPHHIMILINRGYVWVFLVAAIIGCYGGWFSTQLLMDLIFKINVGVGTSVMVVSTLSIFGIAGLTVGVLVWKAVRTNPAEILKSE